jgi:hypothetical protein
MLGIAMIRLAPHERGGAAVSGEVGLKRCCNKRKQKRNTRHGNFEIAARTCGFVNEDFLQTKPMLDYSTKSHDVWRCHRSYFSISRSYMALLPAYTQIIIATTTDTDGGIFYF